MIVYPNAKINIGLFVTEKRTDGFHNLETVFYPVGLSDILEVKPLSGEKSHFINTGIAVNCKEQDNLVMRAYELFKSAYSLPSVQVHLHKQIPFGAGLGGGSSDAAFMLKVLNELFELNIDEKGLVKYASGLGSDCPFFIKNRPVFAHGKGELMEDITLSLSAYKLVLVKPVCNVSTPEAYSRIQPKPAALNLKELCVMPVQEWKGQVVNDFEANVFDSHPEIKEIKNKLYDLGAVYASMSGSGSAVFGLFKETADLCEEFPSCFVWQEK